MEQNPFFLNISPQFQTKIFFIHIYLQKTERGQTNPNDKKDAMYADLKYCIEN